LNGEENHVSRTIFILVLKVLKWLEFPSVSYIYLPEPCVHGHDPQNVFAIQPFDAAGNPRRFYYTSFLTSPFVGVLYTVA
jgi:hypothetical protein